ncbi:unnamed protein product [Nezara viridula]|uniref:Uncharacterized protein n=1 Tax=Nezara viridula TaxID=85310 RepID=A0A9P0HSV0_NEZVI|nr:unnamed protein product [Nezara viridula]
MQYSYLIFLAVVCTAQSVLSMSLKEISDACKKEYNFDGDLDKINYDDPEFPKEAKCTLACSFEKKGVMKADGSFDKEKDKEAVEEIVKDEVLKAKLMAAIDECDVTANADKCEAAYEFVKCKKAKMKADGSFDKEKDKEAVEEIVKDEVLKAKLMAAIDECDVTANADKCEAAYEFVKCKKAKVRRS